MINSIRNLILFLGLLFSSSSIAEDTLNNIVKSQQDLDRTAHQENRVVKEDVYSKVENTTIGKINFPVEKNCHQIDKIVIENDFLKNDNTNKIINLATGRCLGALGINKLAIVLQDYLIKSGFVTTRVNIPNQNLATKLLILTVLPGRIENISIVNNDVASWILPFKTGEILNIKDLDQGLEILQKTPNTKVKINIKPGTRLGFSEIIIDTGRTKKWNTRIWGNNWGDKGTGKNLVGGVGYFYNITKLNDLFYLSGTTNADNVSGGYHTLSGYYDIPIGYWDYELFYSNSRSSQNIIIYPFNFKYSGESNYLSFKTSRVVYRDQNKKITLFGELLRRRVDYNFADEELILQKRDMSNARLGFNFKRNMPSALLDTTLSYQRFISWFGAKKTPDMLSGDVSQNSDIFSVYGNYTRLLNLANIDAYYEMYFGGQYSPSSLTLQDQLTIGDRTNVRGFENTNGIYGDNGIYVQNTFNFVTGFSNVEAYFGNDYGVLFHHHNQQKSFTLIGARVGIKNNVDSLGYDLSVSTPLAHPQKFHADDVIISFNLTYQL